MKPGLRLTLTLGALGLGRAGAVAARAAIVGTALLGFWPLIAIVTRRAAAPSRG